MATVDIDAGVCGHSTTVRAVRGEGYNVQIGIESTCPHVCKISAELAKVDALKEIGVRGELPSALKTAYKHCVHAACPVPSGLVKAIEVAGGLALARDVSMKIDTGE